MKLLFILSSLILCQCSKPPPLPPENPKNESVTDAMHSENNVFRVAAHWVLGPSSRQNNSVRLTLTGVEGPITKVESITFDPQMPSMGHGTFVDDQVIGVESPSSILIDKVFFVMGGHWVIHFTLSVNGIKDTALIPVDVP